MLAIYKIVLQVAAHVHDPKMRLHHFSKYLCDFRLDTSPYYLTEPQLSCTFMSYAAINHLPIVAAIVDTLRTLNGIHVLVIDKYPGLEKIDLLNLFIHVRSRSLMLSHRILSPVFDSLERAVTPNC